MSASFGKRLSFCTWVQFRHLPEGGDTDRGAAGPQRQPLNRRELRRRMAPRSSGSAALARRRAPGGWPAHRSSTFGCAARQLHRQRPSRLTTDQERYFRHARLLSDGIYALGGSSWRVVISPAEWLLLAGRLSRDSGAYSVTTWVTRRSDSGRLGKEIGSWLRPFRVGHVAQAAADRDWCAQESLMAARAGVGG